MIKDHVTRCVGKIGQDKRARIGREMAMPLVPEEKEPSGTNNVPIDASSHRQRLIWVRPPLVRRFQLVAGRQF